MHLSVKNFLSRIKELQTGGGVNASGSVIEDSGFLKDITLPLTALAGSGAATITDNTTGTAGSTLAAGAGYQTIEFAHTFIGGTSAVEPVTNYTPGFKFKIIKWAAVTDVLLVGSGGSRVANMEIGTVDVGTVVSTVTVVEANAAVGTVTAGTTVTGANTGTSTDTISIEIASGGTAFTAGKVNFVITLQNMDTADAIASLAAQSNSSGLDASETNLLVQSFAAGTTAAGSFSIVVPRDYDENTDTLAVKVAAAMAGSSDTTTGISVTVYRKRPGASIATVATAVEGKLSGISTGADLTTASQVLSFNISRFGLQRDDALTFVFTAQAHATDALLVYSVEPVYRSTLVSYDETDDSNTPFNGQSLR